jgi:integrase
VPALQRGQVDEIGHKRYRLRWYDDRGERHSKQPFTSKSAAWRWYRELELNSEEPQLPELTLKRFVGLYLERHGAIVRARTIATLKQRLSYPVDAFGDVSLSDLERMSGDIATWQTKLPARSRYGIVSALRQALEAAVRWGLISKNPAKLAGRNPQPAPRTVRAFTRDELDAIAAELDPRYAPLPAFAAATGLRPEEWRALERRDIDRRAGVVNVRRTVSDGEVVELGKTSRSRRQVPLTSRALAALDALPARLDSALVFPAPDGGVVHENNFRNRQWAPAVEAAGIATPARLYDLRSTFATNALAAKVSVFELAKIMGTSVQMIEKHYGSLLDGAAASITQRLEAFGS